MHQSAHTHTHATAHFKYSSHSSTNSCVYLNCHMNAAWQSIFANHNSLQMKPNLAIWLAEPPLSRRKDIGAILFYCECTYACMCVPELESALKREGARWWWCPQACSRTYICRYSHIYALVLWCTRSPTLDSGFSNTHLSAGGLKYTRTHTPTFAGIYKLLYCIIHQHDRCKFECVYNMTLRTKNDKMQYPDQPNSNCIIMCGYVCVCA